ncbi:hypothetical protein GCK72_010750 [Caenorhabditis remanei]|uniref:T-box domain-containing protein n=1 Tax=Caenorhabditis remanei TaxID=31234 RepID=A0A6A5H456_CAERE|nr:hypothetical protein GCK72_010750 [Caenorhabditis remanei]KAF1762488.1 hypothetical protein GCK72_010750 [Caenorhabditis remanei]
MPKVTPIPNAPAGLELEMIAATKPRLMFPSSSARVYDLKPSSEYRIYLRLDRSSCRYQLKEQHWVSDRIPQPKEADEGRMILSKYGQQKGEFFNVNGVSFENVRLSFNKKQTKSTTDTIYVRKFFKYTQTIIVDELIPGVGNRRFQMYEGQGGKEFVVVSHFESSRMSQYYAIGFENIRRFGKKKQKVVKNTHTYSPVILMNHPAVSAKICCDFRYEDPDDMQPFTLPSGETLVRKYGRSYFYPAPQSISLAGV